MGSVKIRVLGPVDAEVDGRPVDLGGPQQRALLAALAMDCGSVVTRDRLVDRLWPDDPPPTAPKLVQKYVSGLRASLGGEAIETIGGGYRLMVDDVDAVRFETAITRLAHSGRVDDPDLLHADAEWRGPPFSGCGELPFVVAERDRLTRIRLEAQLDRLARQLEAGEFAPTTAELERLATEHPEHERIAALLMRGLYASDRQVEALRAYRRLRRHLGDELGVEPSPDLIELEGRILRHDASLRFDAATRSTAATEGHSEPTEAAPADGSASTGEPTRTDETTPSVIEEIRPVVVVVVYDPSPHSAPEDLHLHHRQLADEIARLADRVDVGIERTIGDEVIVLFGVPAHDDDNERAVALANAVVEARPSARVAVAADDALVTVESSPTLLAGTLLDRVREMAAAARAGEPDIGPEVAARMERRAESGDAALVGRDHEIAIIGELWGRVVDDGQLRIVEAIGEAGIGKTRLVHEAIERLDPPPMRVVELGFAAFGEGMLFAALRSSLLGLSAGFDDFDDWLSTLDIPLATQRRLGTQLRPFVSPVASTESGPDEWTTPIFQLYDIVASNGPIVVIVEDLHWGQADAVDRLNDAVVHLADRPILGILTRRPEPTSPELDPRGIAERATLHLGPLPSDAVQQLTDTAGRDLDERARRLVSERSGGNPLFLLQYIQMLLDRPDRIGTDAAPDSVRLVLSARLDHLAHPLRSTIHAASLVPDRITIGAIAAITDCTQDTAASALNVLVRAGLLRRSRRMTGPESLAYEFQHAVVSDVAYGQLTRATRVDLHRRAARWLDETSEGALDELQSAAWHWQQVIELSMAARIDLDESDERSARDALVRAGDRLLHVDATLAIETYSAAATMAPDATVERANILLRVGEITTTTGDFETATSVLAEAAAIYDAEGRPSGAGEALARQARASWFLGDAADIDALLDQAFARLDPEPPSRSHAHAMVIGSAQLSLRGRATEALELADRAIPVVREFGTEQESIRMLHVRGHARFDLDDPDGVTDLEEALDRSLAGGFGHLTSSTYNNLAEIVWPQRGPREGIELAETGLELSNEGGYFAQAAWHVGQICELSFDLGEWDRLLELSTSLTTSMPVVSWGLAAVRGRVRFWRGDDGGLDELVEALDAARSTQEGQIIVSMLASSVSAHALLGNRADARSAGEELVAFAAPRTPDRLREAGEATRGLCRIGAIDLARSLVPDTRPTVRRRRLMWETARGNIAEAEQRWHDARQHFEHAEDGWEAFPHVFEAAHAAWGLARIARRLGENDVAQTAVARARERFARLGATRCLTELAHDAG